MEKNYVNQISWLMTLMSRPRSTVGASFNVREVNESELFISKHLKSVYAKTIYFLTILALAASAAGACYKRSGTAWLVYAASI